MSKNINNIMISFHCVAIAILTSAQSNNVIEMRVINWQLVLAVNNEKKGFSLWIAIA